MEQKKALNEKNDNSIKTGLALEGGAMRGMFTCGVLDVFMENNIRFDGAAGISAGAVFGCNLKSHQIGRAVRYNKKYGSDKRYCSLWSLLKTGDLYGADFCYRELPEKLDVFDKESFKNDPMEFYIGATDVVNGEAIYHLCSDGGEKDLLWMRASASMPMVSRPVEADGHTLLDGGIADPIPLHFLETRGFNRNVVILTQPLNYTKAEFAAMPLAKLLLKRYPALIHALAVRHEVYNAQTAGIREKEVRGEILVIRPPVSVGISRTEKKPEELERVYQMGRREAKTRLQEVKAFLAH